jgi:hypothetical protein
MATISIDEKSLVFLIMIFRYLYSKPYHDQYSLPMFVWNAFKFSFELKLNFEFVLCRYINFVDT